jgi:ubiquitin C-terminal hydrolase
MKKKKIIHLIFFFPNTQEDSFLGCNKWLEVIQKMIHNVYELFVMSTISEITCVKCNFLHNPNISTEHTLSIPIDDKNIQSIQDAVNLFEENELLTINCNERGCTCTLGQSKFFLFHTSNYLIIHLKRFTLKGAKNQKKIFINNCISIKNKYMEKIYSLISVVHHLVYSISAGHYINQTLINGIWYKINGNMFEVCDAPAEFTTCYITL